MSVTYMYSICSVKSSAEGTHTQRGCRYDAAHVVVRRFLSQVTKHRDLAVRGPVGRLEARVDGRRDYDRVGHGLAGERYGQTVCAKGAKSQRQLAAGVGQCRKGGAGRHPPPTTRRTVASDYSCAASMSARTWYPDSCSARRSSSTMSKQAMTSWATSIAVRSGSALISTSASNSIQLNSRSKAS